MSKMIKGVAFDSSPLVSYGDDRASFKHQTLLQDYLELQKEAKAARSKLEAMKLKKLTLQAEVWFLRRRHMLLLKNKSSTQQEHAIVKPRHVETTQHGKSAIEKFYLKREGALRNINRKGRAYPKRNALSGIPSHVFDLNRKDALHGVIEQSHRRATQPPGPNQKFRTNSSRLFDLNKEETTVQTRTSTFDLNQISREEELQEGYMQKGLVVRNVADEKLNNLKLSMCRNIFGKASSSRVGKRKISWQDPVALWV